MTIRYFENWRDNPQSKVLTSAEWKALSNTEKQNRYALIESLESSGRAKNEFGTLGYIPCYKPSLYVTHDLSDFRPVNDDMRAELTLSPWRPSRGHRMVRVSSFFIPADFPQTLRVDHQQSTLPVSLNQVHGVPDKNPDPNGPSDKPGRGPNGLMSLKDRKLASSEEPDGTFSLWMKVRGDADQYTEGRGEAEDDDLLLIERVERSIWYVIVEDALLNFDGTQETKFYQVNPDLSLNWLITTGVPNLFNDVKNPYFKIGMYGVFGRDPGIPKDKLHPEGTQFQLGIGPFAIAFDEFANVNPGAAVSLVMNEFEMNAVKVYAMPNTGSVIGPIEDEPEPVIFDDDGKLVDVSEPESVIEETEEQALRAPRLERITQAKRDLWRMYEALDDLEGML